MLAAVAIALLLAAILFHLWRTTMFTLRRHLLGILALALLIALFLTPYLARSVDPLTGWIALLALFVAVGVALLYPLGRRVAGFLSILLVAACVSGCTGVAKFLTTPQTDDTIGAKVLNDIQGCKRIYNGSLGPTGIQGSFNISCDPALAPVVTPLSKMGTTPATAPQDPPA